MPRYSFFTQAARDGSNIAATSEELVNCYAEMGADGARSAASVRPVPGETAFSSLATVLPRDAEAANDHIYVAAAGSLFEIAKTGTVATLGAIPDGLTSMSPNGQYMAIAAAGAYRVYDGAGTISAPTGGEVDTVGSVAFMDQYTILTGDDNQFEWTDVADPTSRQALNFATAEARDDSLLRAMPFARTLYLFGTDSIEGWYNTGASGANAFARLADGVIDRGLKGYNLLTRTSGGLFFVGDDNVAYMCAGMQIQPVSTPPVNEDLKNKTATRCFYYEDRGHKFACIRFSDTMAWCLDQTTGLWHRRSSGVDFGAWDAVDTVTAWGNWYALNDTTAVYRMAGSSDVAGALRRVMRGKPLDMDGAKFSVSEFEVRANMGRSDLGRDAQVSLRVSRDGGNTWTLPVNASLGDLGDYGQRAIFRALGRGVQFTPELACADDAEIVFHSDANVRLT